MDHNFYSSADGYLGSFHFGSVMNAAALNIYLLNLPRHFHLGNFFSCVSGLLTSSRHGVCEALCIGRNPVLHKGIQLVTGSEAAYPEFKLAIYKMMGLVKWVSRLKVLAAQALQPKFKFLES